MPMIQAVQAAELSAAKPSTQGEMNNQTPRISEIHSAIVAVLRKARAPSARMTPMTPTIQACEELDQLVEVLKTHGEMKRRTPKTRETQSCQRVHAFIITNSFDPLPVAGLPRSMLAGTILAFGSARKLCSSKNLTEYSIQLQLITKRTPCQFPGGAIEGFAKVHHFPTPPPEKLWGGALCQTARLL